MGRSPKTEGASGGELMVCIGSGTCWWSSSPGHNLSISSPSGFLQALASGAFLSCPGKKGSKEAGLRGEQLAPARIVPPLRIPRAEPSGIDPSLWLGCCVSAFAPVLACGVWGRLFPTLSIESTKKPGIAHRTTPSAKRLPCQRELAKIFDF